MKVITIEEHVLNPAVAKASAATARQLNPHWSAAFSPDTGLPYTPSPDVLMDLDEGRIADMDKHGITMQVLSNLTTQQVPADVAADLVRSANDNLRPRPSGVIPAGSPRSRRCPPPSPTPPRPNSTGASATSASSAP